MGLNWAIFQMPHFRFYLSSFSSLLNHFISQLLLHSASASGDLAVLTPSRLSESRKEFILPSKSGTKKDVISNCLSRFYFSSPALRGSPLPILQLPFPPLCLAGIPAPFCCFNSWSSTTLLAVPPPWSAGVWRWTVLPRETPPHVKLLSLLVLACGPAMA